MRLTSYRAQQYKLCGQGLMTYRWHKYDACQFQQLHLSTCQTATCRSQHISSPDLCRPQTSNMVSARMKARSDVQVLMVAHLLGEHAVPSVHQHDGACQVSLRLQLRCIARQHLLCPHQPPCHAHRLCELWEIETGMYVFVRVCVRV